MGACKHTLNHITSAISGAVLHKMMSFSLPLRHQHAPRQKENYADWLARKLGS